jgi:hypothetical protein
LRVIPWHLPDNWGKSTDKPQSGWYLLNTGFSCIWRRVNPAFVRSALHVSHVSQRSNLEIPYFGMIFTAFQS